MNETGIADLGRVQKSYEDESASLGRLDPLKHWVARLDGHCFSTYTRMFVKPFDERISIAMKATLQELMDEFGGSLGFTCSDEMSIVFRALDEDALRRGSTLLFNGKVQKLVSIFASYASVRFAFNIHSHHLISFDDGSPRDRELRESLRLQKRVPYFDCRVFHVPSMEEAAANIVWRSLDLRRNTVSMVARAHFSQERLKNLGCGEMIRLLEQSGVDFNEQPPWFRFGVTVKKEMYLKGSANPKTGKEVVCSRTQHSQRVVQWTKENQEALVALLNQKYWQSDTEIFEMEQKTWRWKKRAKRKRDEKA